MKKKKLGIILIGLLMTVFVIAGCGKQKREDAKKYFKQADQAYVSGISYSLTKTEFKNEKAKTNFKTAQKKLTKIDKKVKNNDDRESKAVHQTIVAEKKNLSDFQAISAAGGNDMTKGYAQVDAIYGVFDTFKIITKNNEKYFHVANSKKFKQIEKLRPVAEKDVQQGMIEGTDDEKGVKFFLKTPTKVNAKEKTVTTPNYSVKFENVELIEGEKNKEDALVHFKLTNLSNETMPDNALIYFYATLEMQQKDGSKLSVLDMNPPSDAYVDNNPSYQTMMESFLTSNLLVGASEEYAIPYAVKNKKAPLQITVRNGAFKKVGTIKLDLPK